MKMMLAKIVNRNFRKSLDKLSAQELPIKTMFKLRGIVKLLREEIQKYDEVQLDAAKKFADKDESGFPVQEKKEDESLIYYKMSYDNMFKYAAEIGEMSRIEIDVPEISINDLSDAKLATDDLVHLEFITE